MIFKEKLFCAIDLSNLDDSKKFISVIENYVGGLKIGLEFFCKNGPEGVLEIKKFGLPIFLDLKLKDIPNTIKRAATNLMELKPNYLSVHLTGGSKMISEIVSIKNETKILGVSMLTSLDENDLKEFGLKINSKEYVENLAKLGIKSGIDGIVSSAQELSYLKQKINKKNFFYVTPGVRLPNDNSNDQKRIITPGQAIKSGASIIIVGRTVTDSRKPIEAIKEIYNDIEVQLES